MGAHLERLPYKVPVYRGASSSSSKVFCLSLFSSGGWCLYITSSHSTCSFFFHFGGGQPLHNVRFLIFRNAIEDLVVRFTFSSLKVFPMIFQDVFSLLRYRCFFKPRILISSMIPCFGRYFFLNVRPLGVPRSTCFLVRYFLTLFLLSHATPTQWVVFLLETVNLFHDSQLVQFLSFG
jgi:hypothetical protein